MNDTISEIEPPLSKGILHLLFNDVLDPTTDSTRSADEITSHNYEKDLYNNYFLTALEAHGFKPQIHLVNPSNFKQKIREEIGDPKTADVILHLCDGSEVDGFLGSSVPEFLEEEGYLYAGSRGKFSRICTDKHIMKDLFTAHNVPTSPYINVSEWNEDLEDQIIETKMKYPLFVKVANSYGSIGLSKESIVNNFDEVRRQAQKILAQYGKIILEEFILGSEFSALIYEDGGEVKVYPPAQKVFSYEDPFDQWLSFKTVWEDWTWAYKLSKCLDKEIEEKIKEIAVRAFKSCEGNSFARVDMRMRDDTGEIFVLEVNDTCGLGPGTSSEFILNLAGDNTINFMDKVSRNAKRYKVNPPTLEAVKNESAIPLEC